ncbi:transglycosylase SLT domain-containing protein [Pasteurella multocida]|nr:transglycosylase SLT domain-containing protein [Pasteurella multocida]
MKLTKIALTYLLTLMSMSLAAASVSVPEDKTQPTEASLTTTNLVQARQIYQKIHQLLQRSQSENTQRIVQALLAKIEDYPLYPYAQYAYLKALKDQLSLAQIEAFQTDFPSFPLTTELQKQWLQQAQDKAEWQAIIHSPFRPKDMASRCIQLQAEYETQPNSPAFSLKQWQQQVAQIWRNGASLPKACDTLFARWKEKGYPEETELKERAVLAFEQGNQALLASLLQQADQADTKRWLNELHQLSKNPLRLQHPQSAFFIDTLSADDPFAQRILLNHFSALIKRLKETDIKNQHDPFEPYAQWANKLRLSEAQQRQWKKHLISHLFDSENLNLQKWRDAQLFELKEDTLTERRLRTALREKTELTPWLDLLSNSAKQKEEWRYWQAKVFAQNKKTTEQAQQIFQQLAKQRGFYPLLASAELNIDYAPAMDVFSSTSATDIQEKFSVELSRIAELREHNATQYMNLEWKALLEKANFEQKLALSHFATEQAWFDLGVEATIQAKAWGYLALRLPNAYLDWFDLHLNNKNVSRTFAMAIARQESAWKPYVSSHANAQGLMQLLPSTAKQTAQEAGLPYTHQKQLFDPFDNIMLGTAHLQQLYDKYGNNHILIAAAYNAGASRVDRWLAKADGKLSMAEFIASIPFYETRGYVQNVLTYDVYYQWLQQQPQQKFSQDEYNRLY